MKLQYCEQKEEEECDSSPTLSGDEEGIGLIIVVVVGDVLGNVLHV